MEYYFMVEVGYRKEFVVDAENERDAYAKAADNMHVCDIDDGAEWWFSHALLYNEQGDCIDEMLA